MGTAIRLRSVDGRLKCFKMRTSLSVSLPSSNFSLPATAVSSHHRQSRHLFHTNRFMIPFSLSTTKRTSSLQCPSQPMGTCTTIPSLFTTHIPMHTPTVSARTTRAPNTTTTWPLLIQSTNNRRMLTMINAQSRLHLPPQQRSLAQLFPPFQYIKLTMQSPSAAVFLDIPLR
jgi:hypothetical protein